MMRGFPGLDGTSWSSDYHHCNVIANTHMVVYDETMTMKIDKQPMVAIARVATCTASLNPLVGSSAPLTRQK